MFRKLTAEARSRLSEPRNLPISAVDPKKLQNASWVVTQVTQLCRSQAGSRLARAEDLRRNRIMPGLCRSYMGLVDHLGIALGITWLNMGTGRAAMEAVSSTSVVFLGAGRIRSTRNNAPLPDAARMRLWTFSMQLRSPPEPEASYWLPAPIVLPFRELTAGFRCRKRWSSTALRSGLASTWRTTHICLHAVNSSECQGRAGLGTGDYPPLFLYVYLFWTTGELKQSMMGGASRQRLSELDNRFLVADCIFVLLSRETCS